MLDLIAVKIEKSSGMQAKNPTLKKILQIAKRSTEAVNVSLIKTCTLNISSVSVLLLSRINLKGLFFSMSGISISIWALTYSLLLSLTLGIFTCETHYWLILKFLHSNFYT